MEVLRCPAKAVGGASVEVEYDMIVLGVDRDIYGGFCEEVHGHTAQRSLGGEGKEF